MKRYLKHIRYIVEIAYMVIAAYFLTTYYTNHAPMVYQGRIALFLVFISGYIVIAYIHNHLQQREWDKETQRQLDEIRNQK